MSYRLPAMKPAIIVALLATAIIVALLAMRWRSTSEAVPNTAQGPPVDCTTEACRVMTKKVSQEYCYADPATNPGFWVYIENDDPGGRTVDVTVTQYGTSPGFPDTPRTFPTQRLSPGPTGKWKVGCTRYFSSVPLPEHVVMYQYFVITANFVPGPIGGGGDCPQSPFAIPQPPPFPPGAPTTKSVFRLRSPISFNTSDTTVSRVFLEYDGANFILQDDRNTTGEHFTFTPDPNGHTYEIAAPNGRLMYQEEESGGDLSGVFPGGVQPPGCLFHLGKKAWVLEPVPGSTKLFFIRSQATGDRLQINFPGSKFGDKPTLHGPTGNLPEQWELVP